MVAHDPPVPPRRALFIAPEADVEPGYIGAAASARGFTVEVCQLWKEPELSDPRTYDLIVPLGSAEAAYDDSVPWLAAELDFVRRATDAEVPVFGICFGAQLLARALGGEVYRASRPEIGWFSIATENPQTIAPGPWLEWHFDSLTPPEGAVVLARSGVGPQAFTFGRSFGVQFHPEVTPAILAAWIANTAEPLERIGVDVEAFQRETERRAPQARIAAQGLFDVVLDQLRVHGVT